MPNDNVLTADARATIMDACQSISRSADALKECHTVDGDWGDDVDAKAFYDAELRLLDRLTALLAHPGQPELRAEVTDAVRDVLAERRRQIEQEGWTTAHDDAHLAGDLALAAACYAIQASGRWAQNSFMWPWPAEWWKPTTKRRDMVKSVALGIAEIERIDRAAARTGASS
ncbi:hypothetical protein KTE57_17320 [Burkholderia multivorans]|uniref:hypothetical protein n=1 Tax=Burkholderia multivorans TaxID=87883 RepID=UPI001C210A25|nr:hypothetical protein [Burkholderia multivorans]MBU9461333.1 hypothetical protein [Burkholderia multivorans]